MRFVSALLLLTFFGFTAQSQIVKKDTTLADFNKAEQDSLVEYMLEDVYIGKDQLNYADKKEFLILQNRVYKVYPYARIAAERLMTLDRNMSKLKTEKEKKKYYKIVEDYIENEFSEKLKKLSRKQGQILIKLIYRQTGRTTFSIIKDYKSGWKAFWSSNTAKVFDLDLKRGYDPYAVNEDYLIETILQRAFQSGRLQKQEAFKPVDLEELDKYWTGKAIEQSQKKE